MKDDEKGTYGLTEQEIFVVKQDWSLGTELEVIAQEKNLTVAQVMYAINLNETEPYTF